MVTYEDLMSDKLGTTAEILSACGVARSRDEIEAAVARVDGDKAANRFNKGVAGRGAARFNEAQQAQIARIARCHPDIDFTPLGL